MRATVDCSSCQARLKIPDRGLEGRFTCPKCGTAVQLPVEATPVSSLVRASSVTEAIRAASGSPASSSAIAVPAPPQEEVVSPLAALEAASADPAPLTRKVVFFLALLAYAAALAAPAYRENRDVFGLECLVAPAGCPLAAIVLPFWWPNLLFFLGMACLYRRLDTGVIYCGAPAASIAFLMSLVYQDSSFTQKLLVGFWLWFAAMGILLAGGMLLVSLKGAERRRELLGAKK